MTTDFLPPGTRVRLKVQAMSVKPGTIGSMLYGNIAIRDGFSDPTLHTFEARQHEMTVLRDQSPNPEHVEAVRAWNRNAD